MTSFEVNKKTGFKILYPEIPVVIYDYREMPFYDTSEYTPNIHTFNMPPLGKFYLMKGDIQELDSPITFRVPKLPPVEHKMPNPFGFKIRFDHNIHKATVDFLAREIVFDYSFQDKTLPDLYWIIYHELAHEFYVTEEHTDALALNYFLVKGFNPEQAGKSITETLSENQYYRKLNIINRVLRYNNNYGG